MGDGSCLNGEIVVGYAVYHFLCDEHDPALPELYVRQFFIGRAHRGRGLGSEAFRLLERDRFPRPCRFELDVFGGNARGLEFLATLKIPDARGSTLAVPRVTGRQWLATTR